MHVSENIQSKMQLNTGTTLLELTKSKNVLLVFLRQFGCVFCKEAMKDIAKIKKDIRARKVELVFVHMADNKIAQKYFKEFNLEDCAHISDPHKIYYHAFGLRKGSITQLYGLQTWVRGFSSENKGNKLEVSKSLGDATQMPGIFHLFNGRILESYIHKLASDKPNYMQIAECCLI